MYTLMRIAASFRECACVSYLYGKLPVPHIVFYIAYVVLVVLYVKNTTKNTTSGARVSKGPAYI